MDASGRPITDEHTHERTLFKTDSWPRKRLFLLDLRFFKYQRFTLIKDNDVFTSKPKRRAHPLLVREQ